MEQTKKGWFSCLLTYAGAGRHRLTGSVILSVVSVTAGLLPYYCVFRLIEAFSAGALREEGILTWCGLALGAYLVKILCFGFSTMLSHYAAYHILEGLRLRV
ncbi:MAG: ABC transporter ATP-binding protein, partial [Oscillospiraceae bacterium]|nr:ABC transporter ATP-binding protein [Oscillospiraceae bacterium]